MTADDYDFSIDPEHMVPLFEIVDSIMPNLVNYLLHTGAADVDKILDYDYFATLFRDKLIHDASDQVTKSVIMVLEDEFINEAKDALSKGRKLSAIILIATAIEHKINRSYRSALSGTMPENMVTEVIRSSFHAKSSWIMNLALDEEIPEELNKRLKLLMEARNSIVHYKSVYDDWSKDRYVHGEFHEQINKVVADDLLQLPIELQAFLDSIRDAHMPHLKLAIDAWEAFKKEDVARQKAGTLSPLDT